MDRSCNAYPYPYPYPSFRISLPSATREIAPFLTVLAYERLE